MSTGISMICSIGRKIPFFSLPGNPALDSPFPTKEFISISGKENDTSRRRQFQN
jgi:hypothetical protein